MLYQIYCDEEGCKLENQLILANEYIHTHYTHTNIKCITINFTTFVANF